MALLVGGALVLTGCGDDSIASDGTETGETRGDGDPSGDGDGDPSGDGDGDGDPSGDGDGDGDPSGDGDGDPSGDGDGDPNPSACELDHFVHAPPPTEVDGLLAVPIDILSIDASFRFELDEPEAPSVATIEFQVGPTGGYPVFDLRQTPTIEMILDGNELLDPAQLTRHDFGRGDAAGFSILEVELEPCSIHELTIDYDVELPDAPEADGLSYGPGRLYFDLFSSDLNPGRYLESWIPANMPWDRYPLSLGVELVGASIEHALITNADVEELGPEQWQLEFGPETTAMSPMLVVYPSDEVDLVSGGHEAPNGQMIAYEIWANAALPPAANYVDSLLSYLDEFVVSTGDYAYADMVVYLYATNRSMEYAGATTSSPSALRHEVFHSWWARGLEPATYSDGWLDEAWTMFNTYEPVELQPVPFNWNLSPVELYDPHPFARDTPDQSYFVGRGVFAGIADLVGLDALRTSMADLYAAGPIPRSITTAELERYLYCTHGELAEIRQAFHRWVYGMQGQADDPPDDYCL